MDEVETWVNVVIEQGVDEFGRTYQKTQWRKLDAPLSLGSINNQPTEKIIQIKILDKSKPDFQRMFGGFFR